MRDFLLFRRGDCILLSIKGSVNLSHGYGLLPEDWRFHQGAGGTRGEGGCFDFFAREGSSPAARTNCVPRACLVFKMLFRRFH